MQRLPIALGISLSALGVGASALVQSAKEVHTTELASSRETRELRELLESVSDKIDRAVERQSLIESAGRGAAPRDRASEAAGRGDEARSGGAKRRREAEARSGGAKRRREAEARAAEARGQRQGRVKIAVAPPARTVVQC